MVRPLSEQLSDLSVHAKNAEDAVAAAKKEAHDKIVARRDQTRADVNAAIEQVNQDFKSVANTASRDWSAVKAKVASDAAALKKRIEERKHDLTVARAENYAEMLEDEAAFAMLSHPLSKQNWPLSMPSSAALRLNVPGRPKRGGASSGQSLHTSNVRATAAFPRLATKS